jgi:hypothetical protein
MYQPEIKVEISDSEIKEYTLSRLVTLELAYIKPIPSNMKQEDNPPNKKYVRADPVEDSEFL